MTRGQILTLIVQDRYIHVSMRLDEGNTMAFALLLWLSSFKKIFVKKNNPRHYFFIEILNELLNLNERLYEVRAVTKHGLC